MRSLLRTAKIVSSNHSDRHPSTAASPHCYHLHQHQHHLSSQANQAGCYHKHRPCKNKRNATGNSCSSTGTVIKTAIKPTKLGAERGSPLPSSMSEQCVLVSGSHHPLLPFTVLPAQPHIAPKATTAGRSIIMPFGAHRPLKTVQQADSNPKTGVMMYIGSRLPLTSKERKKKTEPTVQ